MHLNMCGYSLMYALRYGVAGTSDIGPGDYKPPPAACDPQVDSRKPTCANFKFGEGYKRGGAHKKFDLSEPSPG
jgi:hypothetical protein